MALVVLYPLAKRFTYWPQVVLGKCFNCFNLYCLVVELLPYASGN